MQSANKHFFRITAWCLAFLVIVFILSWEVFLHTPIVKDNDLHYFLHQGISASEFADDLQTMTHLQHPFLFKIAVRLKGIGHQLQAGEYLFQSGSSVSSILNKLVNGQVVLHSFTIVNGWTFQKVLKTLHQCPFLKHTLKNKSQSVIRKLLMIKQNSVEGWLYPETYNFPINTTELDVLRRAHQAMVQYLHQAWKTRASDLAYKNSYQALIVASMIEKETSLNREKPIISAVILKRLKKRMRLQIDATVVYGLGRNFKGHLTHRNMYLKTPYNTYMKYGLPPTPISMPSVGSINAALHPADTEVLYFVAKGDGSHVFSNTLKQHEIKVKKYQIRSGD